MDKGFLELAEYYKSFGCCFVYLSVLFHVGTYNDAQVTLRHCFLQSLDVSLAVDHMLVVLRVAMTEVHHFALIEVELHQPFSRPLYGSSKVSLERFVRV